MKVTCYSKTKKAAFELHLFKRFHCENSLEPAFLFANQKERLILDGEGRVT